MNSTQLIGVFCYAAAGLLCLCARKKPWVIMAVVNFMLGFECMIGVRHFLHDAAIAVLGDKYGSRSPMQFTVTVIFLITCAAAAFFSLRRSKGIRLFIASISTMLSISIFVVEMISIHELDSIMYKKIGPVLSISFLWIAFSMPTAFSAASVAISQDATSPSRRDC